MNDVNTRKNVIVTDAQYRAAVSAIRELSDCGFEITVAYPMGEPVPLGVYSNGCGKRHELYGDMGDSLLRLAREQNAVIFPGGARFLKIMARQRDDFTPYALVLPSDALKKVNDKTFVASTARSLGIRVPETLDINEPNALSYPVIAKYADGEALGKKAAERYVIAKSPEQLEDALRRMGTYPIFVSEYITGGGFGVSVLMDRSHRAVRVFCHERLREYPLTGGPSVMCRSVWCENMARDAVRLLKALEFEGFAMVEFKGTPDNFALLEINPRVWGSYPLQYLAGAGFAACYVRAVMGESLEECLSPDYRLGVKMQFFISGARWAAASAKRGRSPLPVLQYVSDIFNPAVRHGLWSLRDIKPGLKYARTLMPGGTHEA